MSKIELAQVAFWRRREAEERDMAAQAIGGARIAHLETANDYAVLITQASRPPPDTVND